MSIIVLIETENSAIRKTSLEAIAYATQAAHEQEEVIAIAVHQADLSCLASAGQVGASKVYHPSSADHPTSVTEQISSIDFIKALRPRLVIAARSSANDQLAAQIAAYLDIALISGVVALPTYENDTLHVKKAIFTGKAFMEVASKTATTILLLRKNILDYSLSTQTAEVIELPDIEKISNKFKIIKTEKSATEIALPEADLIVSGGRGMQGPEHWQPLLDLATALGAATGCSKPVSDLNWRPHHEHIGQTGIKVAPNLYIACGISGAIQHLAGVNGSKCIVVINKDPDAPFFKEATYGVVGDVFDILPRLTKAVIATK